MWLQKTLTISRKSRGFHLITEEILFQLEELSRFKIGVLQLFIQHTSASLSINENADPSVRRDLERFLLKAIPDADTGRFNYEHDYEGADDMPAHIKASLIGSSVSIPVKDGHLCLGTWQGIYLGEHRIHGGERRIIATLNGESDAVM